MTETLEYPISNRDWWFKVVGMLNENWALIEESSERVTVYFFHSCGTTKISIGPRNGPWAAIVDSLEFSNHNEALNALLRNGFRPFAEISDAWEGNPPPEGKLCDAREKEPGVYSKEGYWQG